MDKKKEEFYDVLKEAFADKAHESWAGWQDYVFSKSTKNTDGTYTIPEWAVDRWKRQIKTPYEELSETEKDSDRKESVKYMDALAKILHDTGYMIVKENHND